MGYPITDKKSIFDISQFGMPNDLLNLKLPALANFNIDPSAQYFTGGMDASSLNFGQFRGLPTIDSNIMPDYSMNPVPSQPLGMNFSPDLGGMPKWGNDPTVTGSYGDAPTFDPYGKQSGSDLGWNMGTLQTGLQGLSTIGNLWGAYQGNKLARKQLALATDAYNTNLTNSIKSYNTQLEDRIRGRHAPTNAAGQAEADRLIEANKLTR